MPPKPSRAGFAVRIVRSLVAVVCAVVLAPGDMSLLATPLAQGEQAGDAATKLPPDELDSLVAPIALYPDPMLAQTLAASTYPIEIIQLQQWLGKNKNLKDQALADAVKKQDWDPSVQALAALPDLVKQLAENIKWTTDLGNAFLAQQDDVMAAVQRMRKKAKDGGNLKSTKEQKVETQTVENKQVIVIQQANPEVVYVPSYNPTVVYGAPAYPYPPISYPPPGYYAAGMAISFGVGLAMGAAWGGGWGWGCGWGGGNNNVYINNNNNFVSNRNFQGGNRTNIQGGNRVNAQNRGSWQHNPQHRGGAPYSDRNTANRYGGSARGDSLNTRQANARRNQGQSGSRQRGSTGTDRASAGNRPSQASARDRGGSGGVERAGLNERSGGRDSGSRGGAASASNRAGGGGRDSVGNRSVSSGGGGSRGSGAFGGSGSGSSARSSSSRGASSMGRSRGGGRRR